MTDFSSTVPEYAEPEAWNIEPEGERAFKVYRVLCVHRKDCGLEFWVTSGWFWERRVDTRPCPYCFRIGWLPGKKPAPKKRRVVRRKKSHKRVA